MELAVRLPLRSSKEVMSVVIAANDQRGADIAVRRGEIVFQRAFFRHFHAVGRHIVAFGVQTGENAVPLGLRERRLHAELFCDGLRHFNVEADQLVPCSS